MVAPAPLNTTDIRCPQCSSQRIWKDGLRQTRLGPVQRFLCRECGYQFSNLEGSGRSEGSQRIHTLFLKTTDNKPSTRQICATQTTGAKNLAETQEIPTQEKAQRGATLTRDPATVKGKLVEFALWLSKQGYDEDVAKWRSRMMRRFLDLGADLWNPETVKEVLAKQKSWSDSYKMVLVYAYENFLTMEGLSWKRPRYKQNEVFPFIPTEAELDQLIAACGKKIGTFLQGLKDTGADPGELAACTWTDINIESRTVQLRPVKGHKPRVLTASQQFIDRLQRLPKTSERVFGSVHGLIGAFVRQRRRVANKFANPRFLSISFRTFRHWKATMEYHRTKDILYVQKILGHRQIRNTLKYIDLEAILFKTTDDQFFVKVATNVQEACDLVETGFDYVTGEYDDGGKIFRKRK